MSGRGVCDEDEAGVDLSWSGHFAGEEAEKFLYVVNAAGNESPSAVPAVFAGPCLELFRRIGLRIHRDRDEEDVFA